MGPSGAPVELPYACGAPVSSVDDVDSVTVVFLVVILVVILVVVAFVVTSSVNTDEVVTIFVEVEGFEVLEAVLVLVDEPVTELVSV